MLLSLVADLENSFKHAKDVKKLRKKHEKDTGSPTIGDLVWITTHVNVNLLGRNSQHVEITFRNAEFDAYHLANEAVKARESLLATEGIVLAGL